MLENNRICYFSFKKLLNFICISIDNKSFNQGNWLLLLHTLGFLKRFLYLESVLFISLRFACLKTLCDWLLTSNCVAQYVKICLRRPDRRLEIAMQSVKLD
ncbi:hypothetical protein CICLE_v10023023mg [Citrus x clementina]|uniref:Uncharacterized protein n=1 Tax=Citrus clementina TaxID=85681 RepID=V4SZF7_CITCL|nr:hypothetical protein CICLE_v10023023mg [Citrus x clementina]